jgi:hypothetical protein
MWKNIIIQGLWQIVVLGVILFKGIFLFIEGPDIFGIPSSIDV